MSMSVSGVGGYGAINPYEAYEDLFSRPVGPEDALEMADAAADFDSDLDRMQTLAEVRPADQNADMPVRIEPAEESSASTGDHIRRDLSYVAEDLRDIQGSLWGFTLRRTIPLAQEAQANAAVS